MILHPTNKRGTKAAYTAFRKYLLSDGFILWGPELYMRVVTNRKSADTHIRRLQNEHPNTGIIRILRLTEKQFASIWNLTETVDYQEEMVGAKEIIQI
ncbi:MAG: CRISPR-associated endonuclease Cas2 [Oscillospiraceae bacterium]|nr:CRISPR-associated endonuclease Cas2 [Oscillospiraceae bacterium]